MVLFVNGIPLVLAEFKEPEPPGQGRLRREPHRLPRHHPAAVRGRTASCICSNGSEAKVGATYAPWEFFGDWKVIDAEGARGVVALETAIRGTCAHDRLLDLIENFSAFIERPGGLIKAFARNHQFLGVNAAIDNLLTDPIRRATSGSGCSGTPRAPARASRCSGSPRRCCAAYPGNWTFVMVTDRTELDAQLHGEFADAGAIPAEASVHATSSAHLRELLAADHRYVFTLIQKFRVDTTAGETEMPVLSDRSDVIVITDEAHRSQYDTLALNMRQALPNASFMGFTGTPLIAGEELTRQQFGDYVSIYNFRDAIEDGATVPLYYENRIPELQLVNDDFSDELTALLEEAELDEDAEGQLARRFGQQYTLLTRPDRLRTIARDLVRALRGPRLRRQGHVRRGRQGRRRAHARPRPGGVGRAPGRAAGPARRAARARAAVAGQPDRADGDHRHGRRRVAVAERDRRPRGQRPRHPPPPRAHEPRGPGRDASRPPTTRCAWCSCAPCG